MNTKAIAMDKNLVVEEERHEGIYEWGFNAFHPLTDISDFFDKNKNLSKNATEDEYMEDFWEDLRQLRKRELVINPVLKIQKFFSGWLYRTKEKRKKQN